MAAEPIRDVAGLPSAFAYEHTDVPPEMTLPGWRRQRAAERARATCRSRRSSVRRARATVTGLLSRALRGER